MKNSPNQMWLDKPWKNPNNKNLCFCVIQDQARFQLTPSAIHNLDRVGMNELEILNLDGCLGKKIIQLPTADIEMLNMLEEKYNIMFNGDEKLRLAEGSISLRTHLNKPLNNLLYSKVGDNWHGSSLLYSESARDYFMNAA
jgi:hypothetical protein